VARACARVDSGLDKAKICSDRRVDADRPRLRAVFAGGKTFSHSLDPERTFGGLSCWPIADPCDLIAKANRVAGDCRNEAPEVFAVDWRSLTGVAVASLGSAAHRPAARSVPNQLAPFQPTLRRRSGVGSETLCLSD